MISPSRWQTEEGAGASPHMDNGARDPKSTHEALDAVFKHAAQVREYALLYLETRKDQVRVTVQRVVTYLILAMLGLICLGTGLAVAVALLLGGASRGLGILLGDQLWAGQIAVALLVLCLTALGVYLGVRSVTGSSRRRTTEKYERRHVKLRSQFGELASTRSAVGDTDE